MSKKAWVIWLLGSIGAAAIVAAPDADRRLFSLSRTHGPSPIDAVGFVVVLLAWSILWANLWRRRSLLPARRDLRWGAAALAASAAGLLTWSVLGDQGRWWMLGAGVLAALQIAAAAGVTTPRRPEDATDGPREQRTSDGDVGNRAPEADTKRYGGTGS